MSGPFGPEADDLFFALDRAWSRFAREAVLVAFGLGVLAGFILGWAFG